MAFLVGLSSSDLIIIGSYRCFGPSVVTPYSSHQRSPPPFSIHHRHRPFQFHHIQSSNKSQGVHLSVVLLVIRDFISVCISVRRPAVFGYSSFLMVYYFIENRLLGLSCWHSFSSVHTPTTYFFIAYLRVPILIHLHTSIPHWPIIIRTITRWPILSDLPHTHDITTLR